MGAAVGANHRRNRGSSCELNIAIDLSFKKVRGSAEIAAIVGGLDIFNVELISVAHAGHVDAVALDQLHCVLVPKHPGQGVGVDPADKGDGVVLSRVDPRSLDVNFRRIEDVNAY